MPNLTRIKNNQITDNAIDASTKLAPNSISASKLANNITYGSNLIISGNLTVNGATTSVDTTTTTVEDPILLLSMNATGAPSVDIGILGKRGSSNAAFMGWQESSDKFIVATTADTDSSTTINVASFADFAAYSVTANTTISATGNVSGGNVSGTAGTFTDVYGTIGTAAQTSITSVGTLTALAVTGNVSTGNVSGTAGTFTNVYGTIGTAAQTSITSVGTLTSLAVTGNVSTGNVSGTAGTFTDVYGTIGTAAQASITSLGNLTSLNMAGNINMGNFYVKGLPAPIASSDAATKDYVDSATSAIDSDFTIADAVGNTVVSPGETITFNGTANQVTVGLQGNTLTVGLANDVAIAGNLTVSGTTTTVNSTVTATVDPVLQIGRGANNASLSSTDSKDRGLSMYYYNGAEKIAFMGYDASANAFTMVTEATNTGEVITGTAGNLVVSTLHAGTVGTASGNLTLSPVGTSVLIETGKFINIADLSNTQVVYSNNGALVGNASLTYNGTTLAVTGNISAGNIEGTLSTAAQTSITSVGTLTSLAVTGNVSAGNVSATGIAGTLSTAAQTAITSVGTLTSLAVTGNVSTGNVSGAAGTFTDVYGTIGTAAQTSITSVGTLTSLAVTGNVSAGNVSATGIAGTLSTAAQTAITSVGTLTSLAVTGNVSTGNVSGTAGTFSDITSSSGTLTFNSAGADKDIKFSGDAQANLLVLDAGTDTVNIGTATPVTGAIVNIGSTNSIVMPKGTTGERPGTGTVGMVRFNTTSDGLEQYSSTGWSPMGSVFTIIASDSFSGDGSTTAFTLTDSQTTASCIVTINGIVQTPTTAYSVSTTTLTFTEAPVSGDAIEVRKLTTTSTATSLSNAAQSAKIEVVEAQGYINVTGNIVPISNNVGSLGNVSRYWHDVWVGPGSLYVNGQKVVEDISGTITVSADLNENLQLKVSGTGDLELAPGVAGLIQLKGNVEISNGVSIAQAGGGNVMFSNGLAVDSITAKTTNTNLGLSGNGTGYVNIADDCTITGNLTVSGTTTTVSSATLTITDKNITVANGAIDSAAADGAGITVDGASATINYSHSGTKWVMNKPLDVTGNVSAGNLSVTTGTVTFGNVVNGGTNGIGNIGSSTVGFNTVFAKSTSAQYADLAENYASDADYEAGTVVEFGGEYEVTVCDADMTSRVAGVVSTNPAYLMNSTQEGLAVVAVALTGRVPTKVHGPILKGDLIVSAGNGYGRAETLPQVGTVIGKALEDFNGDSGVIEVVVGKH